MAKYAVQISIRVNDNVALGASCLVGNILRLECATFDPPSLALWNGKTGTGNPEYDHLFTGGNPPYSNGPWAEATWYTIKLEIEGDGTPGDWTFRTYINAALVAEETHLLNAGSHVVNAAILWSEAVGLEYNYVDWWILDADMDDFYIFIDDVEQAHDDFGGSDLVDNWTQDWDDYFGITEAGGLLHGYHTDMEWFRATTEAKYHRYAFTIEVAPVSSRIALYHNARNNQLFRAWAE